MSVEACHLAARCEAHVPGRKGEEKRREELRATLLPAELTPAATSESVGEPQPPLSVVSGALRAFDPPALSRVCFCV